MTLKFVSRRKRRNFAENAEAIVVNFTEIKTNLSAPFCEISALSAGTRTKKSHPEFEMAFNFLKA